MAKHVLAGVYVTSTAATPIRPNATPPSQSMAAAFTTVATNISFEDHVSYQIAVTTTNSVGTFYLQASDDNSNFVDVGTIGTAAAANDNILMWVNNNFVSPYLRVRYASDTAGTGTCTILLTAKTIGA